MLIAVQTWDLHLEGCQSLKDKRSVLAPVKSALRRSLNLSIAETEHQDLWQRAGIACAVVGTDRTILEDTLRSADRLIESADGIRIIETAVSYL